MSSLTASSLTAFDMIVVLALIAGLVTGFIRGFVQEILSLGALILALIVLKFLHAPLVAVVTKLVGFSAAPILAFALIMLVVWGGGKYLAYRIGKTTKASFVGPVDRILGAGFGVLKALLIMTAIFMMLMLSYNFVFGGKSERPEWLEQSRTYPLMSASSELLSSVVAERIKGDAEADSVGAATSTGNAGDGGNASGNPS